MDECDLAFVITDAGAMLWHVMEEKASGGGGGAGAVGREKAAGADAVGREASLQCDEEYEKHIDFRWDSHVVKQVRGVGEGVNRWGEGEGVKRCGEGEGVNKCGEGYQGAMWGEVHQILQSCSSHVVVAHIA